MTILSSKIGWALCALLMGAVAMASASADDQAAVLSIVNNVAMRQHVIASAGQSTVMLQNPCPDAQYTVQDRISFYQTPQVDAWQDGLHRVPGRSSLKRIQE